ncbi:MAG: epoxyqueuosine reductase QueH [Alphaproteobacteria bacterium]|nr:epoxyqueuosine reductase QueH [Alphaproteobacteria bacterium]MCL2757809.1 epoxyqueuosine reductase QueH [Alphaproteobacteria bacterium]
MSKNNPRLVLLSCCAPCSVGAATQLREQGADFCVLFHNPNIYPESEYQKRLAEQIRLCESMGVKYVVGKYDRDAWAQCVKGMEDEPERGRRCAACFRHRIEWGARYARDNGYDAFATVFGVSKHKDQCQVDAVAKAAEGQGVRYIPTDWDEDLHQEIIKKAGFYRQSYCGCEFSMKKTDG